MFESPVGKRMNALHALAACLCGSEMDYYQFNASGRCTESTQLFHDEPKTALLVAFQADDPPLKNLPERRADLDAMITDIIHLLCSAKRSNYGTCSEVSAFARLFKRVNDIVDAQGGWSQYIAQRILNSIQDILEKAPEKMGEAMKLAHDRAIEAAKATIHFAKDRPAETVAGVLLTIVAIGILVELAPMVVEVLGFAELGLVEGSFAAWWESAYAGYIPKGSMFSFFQRLGMIWGRNLVAKL